MAQWKTEGAPPQPTTIDVVARRAVVLAQIYGEQIPTTALVLDDYLRTGCIPLRDPDDAAGRIVTVNLRQAAAAFGGDPAETDGYLHRLHASGQLLLDQDGAVDITTSSQRANRSPSESSSRLSQHRSRRSPRREAARRDGGL
jgi:hypothetical protein